VIIIATLFAIAKVNAQVPVKPEDISPLLIGEEIPSATLKNPSNEDVDIRQLFRKRKTILIVYRGGWCPYCNAHLSEVGRMEKDLINLGYQMIAVTPDAPSLLQSTVDKTEVKYTLLSDPKCGFIKSMGLAFKAPHSDHKFLDPSRDNNPEQILPVPSLFIINRKGEIAFEYINPNFKTRITGYLLLSAAKVVAEQDK
jgi:peroxiredoxin